MLGGTENMKKGWKNRVDVVYRRESWSEEGKGNITVIECLRGHFKEGHGKQDRIHRISAQTKKLKLGFQVMSGWKCARTDCWGMAQSPALEVFKNRFHKHPSG